MLSVVLFQTIEDLNIKKELLNALKPQCPVGLVTLRFANTKQVDLVSSWVLRCFTCYKCIVCCIIFFFSLQQQSNPYVYTNCGHVHGYHVWGARPSVLNQKENNFNDKRICPFCKEVLFYRVGSPFLKNLALKLTDSQKEKMVSWPTNNNISVLW